MTASSSKEYWDGEQQPRVRSAYGTGYTYRSFCGHTKFGRRTLKKGFSIIIARRVVYRKFSCLVKEVAGDNVDSLEFRAACSECRWADHLVLTADTEAARAKIQHPGSQTGIGNMAAIQKFDFSTPVSYSTPIY